MSRASSSRGPYPPDEVLNWTPRQHEVLNLLARGKSNAEIADALGISLEGAKYHVREIMSKLDVESRQEAAEYWRRRNGLPEKLRRAWQGALGIVPVKWLAVAGAMVVGVVTGAVALTVALGGTDEETPPIESPMPAPTYASETVFEPQEEFDLEHLPRVDTSTWITHTGEVGLLRVSAPPDWIVEIRVVEGLFDEEGQTWDSILITKPVPPDARIGIGRSYSGWVRIELRTPPFVPAQDEGDSPLLRRETLANELATAERLLPRTIEFSQWGQSQQFPDFRGSIRFMAEQITSNGTVLIGFADVHFDARADDIATTIAILQTAELLQ